jgi:hypothetical protein
MPARPLKFFALFLTLALTCGCNEYWWSRGQPPAVETVFERAHEKVNAALHESGTSRTDIAEAATAVRNELASAVAGLEKDDGHFLDHMREARRLFESLEGKLSWGSRAPYGELAGQIRVIIEEAENGGAVNPAPVKLLAARTFFFLADELRVPAPKPV